MNQLIEGKKILNNKCERRGHLAVNFYSLFRVTRVYRKALSLTGLPSAVLASTRASLVKLIEQLQEEIPLFKAALVLHVCYQCSPHLEEEESGEEEGGKGIDERGEKATHCHRSSNQVFSKLVRPENTIDLMLNEVEGKIYSEHHSERGGSNWVFASISAIDVCLYRVRPFAGSCGRVHEVSFAGKSCLCSVSPAINVSILF